MSFGIGMFEILFIFVGAFTLMGIIAVKLEKKEDYYGNDLCVVRDKSYIFG